MSDGIFTVDQVAERLDLHPKTVRRFIREGKLHARKVGGQWRITEQDIRSLIGDENREEGASAAVRDIAEPVADLLPADSRQRVQVTSIVDVYVDNTDDVLRIANTLLAIMMSKGTKDGNARVNHVYHPDEGKARFLLWGSPIFMSKVLQCIAEITK